MEKSDVRMLRLEARGPSGSVAHIVPGGRSPSRRLSISRVSTHRNVAGDCEENAAAVGDISEMSLSLRLHRISVNGQNAVDFSTTGPVLFFFKASG